MATKAELKAQAKYDKQNTRQIGLKLNLIHDSDILAKLHREENKQGYIKELIRNDMKNPQRVLTLESIQYLLLPVKHRYGLKSISVFGSYARNEATPTSDVDLIIEGGNYNGLIEYTVMVEEMKAALGRNVDVITQATLDQSSTKADFLFKNQVEREKVVLI